MQWLEQRCFRERVMEKWPIRREGGNVQDFWRDIKAATRRFGRGWRMNYQTQLKKDKSTLLEKIGNFDMAAELSIMNHQQWLERYNMEVELEQIYSYKEVQLRRQSGVKWTLKGDSNNNFFME
jgi:hypothetical protein